MLAIVSLGLAGERVKRMAPGTERLHLVQVGRFIEQGASNDNFL